MPVKLGYIFTIALLMSISLSTSSLAAGGDEAIKQALDEKTTAYNAFIEAVDKNMDEKTIEKYSRNYKDALKKYDALIKLSIAQQTENSNSRQSAEEARAAQETISVSDELNDLIDSIHGYKIKNNPEFAISRLEKIIERAGSADEAALAKMELAAVYAKFKQDYSKSIEILKQVINSAASQSNKKKGQTALERTIYYQKAAALTAEISKKRNEAKNYRTLYQNTPLTSPFKKAGALIGYYKEIFNYRKAIAKYKTLKSEFDKSQNYGYYDFITDVIGARSLLGVEDVFENSNPSALDIETNVKLIADNVEALYARWKTLSEAKRTIDISYFIFDKDPIGTAMLGLLLKKAKSGVKVRLILDAHGCGEFAKKTSSQDYLQELSEAGATVKIFNPIHKSLPTALADIRNLISSNHQKIIIADGETFITGGRNISAHYLADPRDYKEAYMDTDVLLKNKDLAEQLKMTFDEEFDALENYEVKKDLLGNWIKRDAELLDCASSLDSWINGKGIYKSKKIEEFNEEISSYKHMIDYASYRSFKNSCLAPVKLLGKNSISQERNDISACIISLINAASDEIIIQNPYVIFTDQAKTALKAASARGVKIYIHTNSPTCFPAANGDLMTLAFFLDEWMPFLQQNPTARIFGVAVARKLHSKVFVFDRSVAIVGTYNMDPMSENINAENVCALSSREFAETCRAKIFEDMKQSREYKIGINEKGEAYEIFGPGSLGSEETLNKLKLIKKLKFLRPLI